MDHKKIDVAKFAEARAAWDAAPNSHRPIRAMMELLNCRTPKVRDWAKKWLWEKCHIRVIDYSSEDLSNATPPQAANLP